MTEAELLIKVKEMLGVTGEYQDTKIQLFIDSVKDYMLSAGVSQSIIDSQQAVGAIYIGVNDLWNYSGGGVKFSDFFNKRVIQLASAKGDENV